MFKYSSSGRINAKKIITSNAGIAIKAAIILIFVFNNTPLFAHWKIPGHIHNWKMMESQRFTMYYREGLEETAIQALEMAENSAARYEKILNVRLTRMIPVFLYSSPQDFAQTNILPFPLDESTGGFTDFYRRRVVLPFQGDYAVLRHVIDHEIVHAFQFDILGGERLGSYPLWLMEGMAEYLSIGWDQSAESMVRDAVISDSIPGAIDLQEERVGNVYAYYKFGQAMLYYIATDYGQEKIGLLLKSWKSTGGFAPAIQATFGITAEEFDFRFKRSLRARYSGAIAAANELKDKRIRYATNRYTNVGYNLHPAISPDGKKIAYFSYDGIFPAIVIQPRPGEGMPVRKLDERKIVLRALRSADYEEVQLLTTRLSFTPDGNSLLVAGRRQGKQSLLFFDVRSGDLVESYTPPFETISFPALSPDGGRIIFTGTASGKSDLFVLTRGSGSVQRVTDDWQFESWPAFSSDSKWIYYSSNDAKRPDRRHIFRISVAGGKPVQLTNQEGVCDQPFEANGHLIVRSNRSGVFNAYRIKNALSLNGPARELIPVTKSLTGLSFVSPGGQDPDAKNPKTGMLFSELIEGAIEVRLLPEISDTDELPADAISFKPTGLFPESETTRQSPLMPGGDYHPFLSIEGYPFILITAASGSNGKTTAAALAYISLTDDSGDHRLSTLASYTWNPSEINLNVEYAYLKHRIDFFGGAYRQSGVFAVFNFAEFSLNNFLYNPYFRLLERASTGIYGGAEYPLHKFGSVSAAWNSGREERIYATALAEERDHPDVYQNHNSVDLAYQYDNIVYSRYGPLDGHGISLGYSIPVQFGANDREMNVLTGEYRLHHLFGNFSSASLRAFGGKVSGPDAYLYPFQIGGYYSLRGYRYLEFEGRNAFLINLEYRFNFIEYLQFGVPASWSPGLIRGVAFFDAGSAFDRPEEYQAFYGKYGVTRDLHLSFGLGLHWSNFLWFIVPGAIMKIEWATPYDLKRALPLSKWKGEFSVGFNF